MKYATLGQPRNSLDDAGPAGAWLFDPWKPCSPIKLHGSGTGTGWEVSQERCLFNHCDGQPPCPGECPRPLQMLRLVRGSYQEHRAPCWPSVKSCSIWGRVSVIPKTGGVLGTPSSPLLVAKSSRLLEERGACWALVPGGVDGTFLAVSFPSPRLHVR